MPDISAKTVMDLRKQTGAPMMDCKHALVEAESDMEKAKKILRKKGLQTADSRASRDATEGRIFSYVHHNGRLGVLAEIACETDFVARNEEFMAFGKNLCMTVAAMQPRFVSSEEVDPSVIDAEREVVKVQTEESMKGKPAEIIDKAVEGRLGKFLAEICLLDQPWVLDPGKTVDQVRKELVGKIGENIQVRSFRILHLGG